MSECRQIREQDPLKQGLKLEQFRIWNNFIDIREQDPLKQGLKPNSCLLGRSRYPIREQDPLKQGLKLHTIVHHIDGGQNS